MKLLSVLGRSGLVLLSLLILALVVFRTVGRPVTTKLLGEARVHAPRVPIGDPLHGRAGVAGVEVSREQRMTGLRGELIRHYASHPLPDWEEESKVHAPRVLFAKLSAGVDVAAVNEYLLSAEPTAASGSSWELRPVADYDFTEIILAAILMEFADDPEVLWTRTQDHLVDTLLIESGYRVRWTVPGSIGVVQETENHILMTEVSRYLRNLWLTRNRETSDRHRRLTSRHAGEVAAFLRELDESGLYEFNSQPYGGYTMAAALVAFSYAEDPMLRESARRLLDRQAMQFALGSHRLRRVVPFRRQLGRAQRTSLFEDPMAAIASIWAGFQPGLGGAADLRNGHHAVVAALTSYQPGEAVMDELLESGASRLVVIGRGPDASPEIHSTGPDFHISSGGVAQGRAAGIAARPTVLLLADGATDLSQLFRLPGSGEFTEWNNTGVHHRLAVGNAPVLVPHQESPALSAGPFELFLREHTGVVVVRQPGFGLIHVLSDDPFAAFGRIVENNVPSQIRDSFVDATGRVFTYDLDAPPNMWMMNASENGPPTRTLDAWPRLRIYEFRE